MSETRTTRQVAIGTPVSIEKGVGRVVGGVAAGYIVRLDADGSEWIRTGREVRPVRTGRPK